MSLVSSTSGGHAHKVVKESADLPGVLKRKIYRDGGGKNKHLLQAKYEDLQQELLSTKQAIVRHVIQSRAIEQSKNDLVLIQQSLHRTILEKNDPDLLKYLEIRKLATFYAFNNQYPNYALHRIDQSMSWKYSGLVQYLIEKLSKYSNQEFKQALESNTIEDISLDLYTQIVSNATHFMISMKDIESMFNLGKEMYEASVTMNSPSNTTLWEVLKRKLYRKLLHLYILQQAVLYITDAEKKLQYKEHFQFKIDKSDRPKSQQSQNPNNASILDSQRIFTSSSIDPFHQNDNKSLLSASLSSLELKKPSTASSSINHGKKNKKHPQQPSVLLPKLQLEKELEKSRQQQFYLKEQIVQNFHEIVLQDSQLRKQQQTPSISSSMTSLSSSHGNSSLPIISPRYNSRPIATPAIKQYYYNIGLNKLFLFLQDRYLKKLYQKKFLTWQKYLIQCQNEKNVINFCKQASYYRFFRVFQYNIVRRIYTRFSTWSKYCKYYKQREQLSAVITMQRFWRGYLARKARKQVTAQRAAKCINGIIRIFAAKKLLRYRRIKVLQRKSAKKIESAWYKSRFRLSINQRVLAKRKIRYIQLMQRVYRGYKGRLRAKKRKQFLQMISGATKFQSLFRRYQAVIRVEKMRIRRNRLLASILIQKHIRRKLQAAKFAVVWKRHQKAKIIQYAWYYYKARCVRFEHVKWWKALDIQRVVRGRIGRKRFQHFYDLHQAELKRRAAAVKVIEPIILGYATRRRLKDILNSYLQRRQRAARVIQVRLKAITLGIKARQRVEEMRALGALVLARERGALKIQTQIRRKLAIVRVKRLLDKKLIEIQREEMKIPYYFRIKKRYYLSQNTYHYQYVLRIQCLARRFLARRKVERRKEERKNDVFESIRSHSFKSGSSFDSQSIKMMSAQFLLASRSGKLSEKDSQRLKEFRELEVVRSYFAVIVQRYYRGFHIRSNFKRNKAIPALIWFCRETKVRFHIKQFLRNYRLWKLEQIRRHMAVTKIAALARGRQQRKRFKKNYRLLVRQRELRIRAKRLKAAITIQCSYRCVRARRRVIKQRKIVEERDREKRELQELEDSIQGLHERWMHELMAIRAQTGVRGMLARSEFAKRLEAFKKQDQEEKKNKRDKSAIVIQALARGVVSRKKFKKNLPNLKKQQKMKIFCVQCEQQIALKRCRQCRDRFCNECYDIIHQKGNRKNHSWENIKVDARMLAMAYDSGNNANAGNLQASQRVSTFGVATTRNVSMMNTAGGMGARNTIAEPIEPVKKVNPKDWEEFYDESARAKYWYNKKTGEASWINPFK